MTRQTASLSRSLTPTSSPLSSGLLQHKCACGQHTVAGEMCEECQKEPLKLQRRAMSQVAPSEGLPIVHKDIQEAKSIQSNGLFVQRSPLNRYSFENLESKPREQFTIQAKLAIGQPNDQYEQEADLVADQVMRMLEPPMTRNTGSTAQASGLSGSSLDDRVVMQQQSTKAEEEENPEETTLRTKPLASSITPLVQRQVKPPQAEEEGEDNLPLQTKSNPAHSAEVSAGLQVQITSLQQGGGQPLPATERSFFEPRFGYDFSQVRIHTGGQASATARAVNAHAYTVGRDVVFGAGQYAPQTSEGRRLLAHELTHVVQQTGKNQSAVIQTEPNTEENKSENAVNETELLIKNAVEAIEQEGGKAKFYPLPADPDGNSFFIIFENSSVHKLHRHLLKQWLGVTSTDETWENAPSSSQPKWVGEYRARARKVLNSPKANGKQTTSPKTEDEQLAELALELADSVATPAGEKFRENLLTEAKNFMKTDNFVQPDMPKNDPDYTTCIAFAGIVWGKTAVPEGAKKVRFGGIAYSQISGPTYTYTNKKTGEKVTVVNPTLPKLAWKGLWEGGSYKYQVKDNEKPTLDKNMRPNAGDFIILTTSVAKTLDSGKKLDPGSFAHIAVFQSRTVLDEKSGMELWKSIDGGREEFKNKGDTQRQPASAGEGKRIFDPKKGLFWRTTDGVTPTNEPPERCHGWIDTAELFEAGQTK